MSAKITRREFLELSTRYAALIGLSSHMIPDVADALEHLVSGQVNVLWLSGQSCSGCSVSLLNSADPGPAEILTRYISLLFHSTLSTATGHVSMDLVDNVISKGDYILVVEGSVPYGMPEACKMGGKPVSDLILSAATRSKAIIAVGTCASFGGIPAAENNPTGALSLKEFLEKEQLPRPVICIPGCPVHPDWFVGTLVHLLKFGQPDMDALGRPRMFFDRLIHDQCPRFSDYERENFAETFSSSGCLFKLGCLGIITHGDCNLRLWNDGTNSCIPAGGPCIGCASESFARHASFSFYRKNEKIKEKL
ncbi:MAG: hydrogenase small subunit [Proteobacteria bacterium]|nr:hydrogenase small subunit [Pseudomonadota bacterium]